ncbi:MAG: hypothetical protein B7Y86_04225 [Brevundimonas subvibrioides]|uniref:Terminase large subunit gp17-like C-terminal domain-containing protein n=1 Tax=Brevundimonas subvibrioides TaxID=74313 RepID=A0A258HPC0_9CAUL|nr:terminase family protein [Brevundimonas subvibrioides]OYX58212.1 MAG: hypothetical protein B7Y86_04225 [Brevundimonas subvibrioides]
MRSILHSASRRATSPMKGEENAGVTLLTKAEVEALHPDDQARLAWDGAAHEAQRAPSGPWRTWVFLGGRGAGKTRAGAEWVSDVAARLGAGGRIALVGATLHDVRAVMVEGPSGLMNLPFRTPPVMESSLRRLVFPGGAVGVMLSAAEPERLRGPQFHAAWGDEFCAWDRPEEGLAMLRLGVRLGARGPLRPSAALRATSPTRGEEKRAQAASDRVASGSPQEWVPRLLLTTTPRPLAVLRRVLAEASCARTHAPTGANAENLAEGFLEAMQDLYGGTRRAAQELDGVVLEAEGALFTSVEMARARMLGRSWMLGGAREGYERAVVAVDPPVGTLSGEGGDACGIVVVARAAGTAWVLDDRSVRGLSPAGWAARVARTAKDWEAALACPVRVVAEGNQGGDMVETVLKGAGVTQVVRRVQARVGKRARAEPVAALYEQGRVGHVGELTLLEEELLEMGEVGGASPDRADALVWAVTDLLIDGGGAARPRAWVL